MRYIFLLIISFSLSFANAHIFVYHRFSDDRYPSANTTKDELIRQFEYFKTHNYKVVSLETILDKLSKKEDIPSNWIAFTIDDAYKSFYNHGLEIFKQYNYPFSLFIYVKATNKHYGDYMRWEQIKEASKYGSIGLHSYSHPRLQNLNKNQIIEDTTKALNIFEKNLGFKPTVYAYPYGEYTPRVLNTLKNSFDFRAILNQNSGSITKVTDSFDIPRIALVGKVNLKHKLRYKSFNVKWQEPLKFPKDGILKKVKATVPKNVKKLKMYITGEGWSDIKVKNGIVDETLNIYLKNSRTRIMLGTDVFTISNNIINKIKLKK